LKKQLQNSRDQLKRAQSDEVAITWFFKWIYLFTYTGVQWYFHIIWCSSCNGQRQKDRKTKYEEIIFDQTLLTKLKIEQYDSHSNPEMTTGAPDG
jgi:hypothetical protein